MTGLAMSCRPVRTPLHPPVSSGMRRSWRRGRLRPRRGRCHPAEEAAAGGGPGRCVALGPGRAQPGGRREGAEQSWDPRRGGGGVPARAAWSDLAGTRSAEAPLGRASGGGERSAERGGPVSERPAPGRGPVGGQRGAPGARGVGRGLVGRRSGRLTVRPGILLTWARGGVGAGEARVGQLGTRGRARVAPLGDFAAQEAAPEVAGLLALGAGKLCC